MGFLTDWLTDWLKELLIEGIMGNLTGLFDTVNTRVGEIAVQVGTTPAAWNAGVFSLIRQLSETVILPIAGLILTFVATYELIQLIIEKNNLHDLDYWIFFKWIFKTACAILILSKPISIAASLTMIAFLWNGRPRSFAAMRNKPGTPSLVLPPSMALEWPLTVRLCKK